MAKALGDAPSNIHRIWRGVGPQPPRSETVTLSSDPLSVEKVRDIVGLYISPPERALACPDRAHGRFLDQTGRALLRQPGGKADPTRRPTSNPKPTSAPTSTASAEAHRRSEETWDRDRRDGACDGLLDRELLCSLAGARVRIERGRRDDNTERPRGNRRYRSPAPELFGPPCADTNAPSRKIRTASRARAVISAVSGK